MDGIRLLSYLRSGVQLLIQYHRKGESEATMRITLSLDDDLHLAVKEAARHEGTTMGKVLSELIRDTLTRDGLVPVKDDLGSDETP